MVSSTWRSHLGMLILWSHLGNYEGILSYHHEIGGGVSDSQAKARVLRIPQCAGKAYIIKILPPKFQ